jgi:branched-chain amino acid transport system permease protein
LQQFIFLTITGLCTAAVFAVAASGLVLTYTTTGVFNFAHGAIGMLGAFMFWQLHVHWGMPTWLALLIVLGVIAPAFGAALEVGIMRRLQGTSDATQLVVSVSLLAATLGLGQWLWSPQESHPIQHFWEGSTTSILGVRVTVHAIFAFGVAVAVAVGLRLLLYRTRAGITMRAAVDDRPLSTLNGAKPDRSAMLAWAIGCSLAALAGILIAPDQGLQHLILALLIVNAYAAALIGRLRSLPLTFLGAVILGLADAYGNGYLPKIGDKGLPGQLAPYFSGFRPAIPIIILFIVLLVLPQSRLRGHTAARSRERFPEPTYRGSLLAAVLLIGVVAVVSSLVTDADALQLSKVLGFAMIALSLVPLVGYAGQISLCQMSFAGIGAVVMAHHGAGGQPIALVYAAIICGLVGAIVAIPALRLSGVYLALATGAFAVILDRWIFNLPSFDAGPVHVEIFGALSLPVDRLHLPGIDPSSEKAYLVVVTAVFCALAMGVVALRRSRYGDRLLALKDSPAACATLGLNLTATKLGVFALSAAMAGVGGAVYAGSLGTVSPERFSFFESLPLLLLAVVGGIGSAGGAVFAGLVLFGIPIVASTWGTIDIAVQSLPGVRDLSDVLKVLPGLMGIGLGRNPNGVVPDLAKRFEPVRHSRPVLVGLGVVLAALVAAAEQGALGGWWFGTLSIVAIFGTIPIAEARERRGQAVTGADDVPLEWIGIDRPYTEADVRSMDEALALPDVVSV